MSPTSTRVFREAAPSGTDEATAIGQQRLVTDESNRSLDDSHRPFDAAMDPPGHAPSYAHASPAPASSPGRKRMGRTSDASDHLYSPTTAAIGGGGTPAQVAAASADKQAFLYSLYDVLSMPNASTMGSGTRYEEIASWLPHGHGFVIHDKPKFEKEVLPRFLPNTKYASFTRRLKRWKFVRVSSGIEMGSYYHPHFQRGKPHLIHLVNTTNTPPQASLDVPSYAITSPTSAGPESSEIHHHPKMFADIQLPYAGFGSKAAKEKRASVDPAQDASDSDEGKKGDDEKAPKKPKAAAPEDVREFPNIMRQISKAKRLQSMESKRRRRGASARAAASAAYAGGMGAGADAAPMGPMRGYPHPYPAMSMGATLPSAAAASGATGFVPRYPPAPASEVADAMMSTQFQPAPYRSRYWESNPASEMMMRRRLMGEGNVGGTGMPGSWNPSMATSSMMMGPREGMGGGSGGMYPGDSMAAASGGGASAAASVARLPPSPCPTPPGMSMMPPSAAAGGMSSMDPYQSYQRQQQQASAMMYGGASTANDPLFGSIDRELMLRQEQLQLRRDLMEHPDQPGFGGKFD